MARPTRIFEWREYAAFALSWRREVLGQRLSTRVLGLGLRQESWNGLRQMQGTKKQARRQRRIEVVLGHEIGLAIAERVMDTRVDPVPAEDTEICDIC